MRHFFMQRATPLCASTPTSLWGWRSAARARGFSLIELMVTIAVAVVLIGLGAPQMVQSLRTQEIRAARDELTAAIQLAEIEAIRRGGNVVLQRKTGCGAALSGAADWRCGYILFADANADGARDPGEPLLKDITLGDAVQLQHTTGGTDTLTMNAWGRSAGGAHRFELTSTAGSAATTSTVCLNLGGQVRSLPGSVTCP